MLTPDAFFDHQWRRYRELGHALEHVNVPCSTDSLPESEVFVLSDAVENAARSAELTLHAPGALLEHIRGGESYEERLRRCRELTLGIHALREELRERVTALEELSERLAPVAIRVEIDGWKVVRELASPETGP